MKILVGHNFYQTFGGEDAVFHAETAMLGRHGHEVITYERNNDAFSSSFFLKKLRGLWQLDWSDNTYHDVRALIRRQRPDVAHFHNIYFAVSPSVYYACHAEGVPVVQSLHNFRLFCSNGLFYRDQKVCEDCLKKNLWQGVVHRCYKNSRFVTYCVNRMLMMHRRRKTWKTKIDMFITASEFGKNKLVAAGMPPEKIRIKPNFLDWDPGVSGRDEGYALYVGRLSEEKGLDTLVAAWEKVQGLKLKIIGKGPLEDWLHKTVKSKNLAGVEILGFATNDEYRKLMQEASFLLVPSRCYENFPRIVAESYAFGKPVIASRLGSLAEIVNDGESGLLFEAGNAVEFAQRINRLATNHVERQSMGRNARRLYETRYDETHNYAILMDIYRSAIAEHKRSMGE